MLKHELAMDFQMSSCSNHATQREGEQQGFRLGFSFFSAVGMMFKHIDFNIDFPVKWNKGYAK